MERSYLADSFDEAIALVKRELGSSAVIVSSRKLSSTSLGGDEDVVEVRAVSNEDAIRNGLFERPKRLRTIRLDQHLEAAGVPALAAGILARSVTKSIGAEPATLLEAEEPLAQALASELSFAPPATIGGPRITALVGPTGVGKTTTIAKIAAVAALIQKREVALVSLDHYRVGGTEQLEQYADLIGVPLEVAHDLSSLNKALHRLRWADQIFIDTAGRSPRNRAALEALSDCFRGAHEMMQIHLCMPVAMRDAELKETVERFSLMGPTRLVLTKLDEALHYGPVVAAQIWSGLPLSYFTTGQRVPEEIKPSSPELLASLLCQRELVQC